LSPNTEYTFQAKARNGDGVETTFGPSDSKYTLANTPPAPTVSNPTQTTLDVDILPNGNPAGTLFTLYNKTSDYYVNGDGGNNGNTPVWLTDGDWGTVTVTGLTLNTTYEFQAKAKNGEGIETDFGPPGTGQTLNISSPILSGEARNKKVILQWDTVPDAIGYKVYRSTTKGSGYSSIADVNGPPYEDVTVANGTTYYYVVTAYQDGNESDYSNEISLTPPFSFHTSSTACFFYGSATINGTTVEDGDIIGAFAEGVEGHHECIGAVTIGNAAVLLDEAVSTALTRKADFEAAGDYVVTTYGNDSTTPGKKDGASSGDIIFFKIWDSDVDEIYDVSAEGDTSWQNGGIKNAPLVYYPNFDLRMAEGWNLISFSVDKCYYDPNVSFPPFFGPGPPDSAILPAGTELVDVTTLGYANLVEWFTSVLTADCGDWGPDNPSWRRVISGLPGGTALVMDTEVPPFVNNLKFVGPGYSYWVKIKEGTCGVTLTLEGARLSCDTPLDYLKEGWNYIGYLSDKGFYDELPEDDCLYVTSQTWEEKAAPVADHVLANIADNYRLVYGACRGGAAIVHDPTIPSIFSTLHFFAVGNGYLIKLYADTTLTYPCDSVAAPSRSTVRRQPTDSGSTFIPDEGVQPTPHSMFLYGYLSVEGQPVKAGSQIDVWTESGLRCGAGIVTQDGVFGSLAVYGDDVTTPQIDGARSGERLVVRVNGTLAEVEIPDLPVRVRTQTAEAASTALRRTPLRWSGQHTIQSVSLMLEEQRIPTVYSVGQNYPNPFNPETWIPYALAEDSPVTLQIYSVTGQLVRTLNLGLKPAGIYDKPETAVYWDGRNEAGEKVSSGIYFYRLAAGNFIKTKRMALIK
jgi:hypothetical protein